MKSKMTIQFSPTRLKQMKKIALSGSRAKLKILNGKLEEGFSLLKSTAHKFKSFATDLADRIPQALAAQISLDLFSHFETKSSKRLGIPKGIVLGGVLALMSALPAAGQTINVTNTADAGAGTLRQAIIDANANGAAGIIRLADGTTYTIASNLPIVTGTDVGGTLQIICTGSSNAIIDGNNAHRPITMDPNSDLTLSSITIQNGRVTGARGGGIYNLQGDLTISDCLITNNNVTGTVANGKGGGIFSVGESSVSPPYGSASVLIQNSTVSGNSSQREGGGILNGYGATMTIFSSTISGNTSLVNGAGLVNTRSSMMTITSSTISGNTSSGGSGGALAGYSNSTTHISDVMISGNTAIRGGGIFQNQCALTISNSIVTNNEATPSSGGGIYSTGNGSSASVLIQNSTISLNSAAANGGGISNTTNSSLTITSSSISGNISNNNYGGGIFNSSNSPLTISSSSISGNTANTGGGICNGTISPLTISNSSISGNISNNYGGGIFNSTISPLTISNSSISGNTSANDGGGVFNNTSSPLTISSSSILGNTSGDQGGGIWNNTSNLSIQASSLSTNQSTAQGGAMMIYGASGGGQNVLIQNTTISGNTSTGNAGGGIYHNNSGGVNNITLQHVTLSDNTGGGTGGFANRGTADITLQNSIIANSTGADFDQGTATINAASTSNIVEDGSLVDASVTAVDPLLDPLTLSTGFLVHPLQAASPALDAADAAAATTNDQLGVLRVAPHDMGAVQFGVVACITVASTPADATNTWIGCTNSDWNTASNWSTGAVPTASDVVYIPIEAVNQLVIDEVATCAKMMVQIGAKCLVNYNAGGQLRVKF
jgi:hypothetical protein